MPGPYVDLAFSLSSIEPIPADHGYLLYSAVSHVVPTAHEPNGIAIHPIRGRIIGNRQMQLCDWSRLTVRTRADQIANWLPLAGNQLNLGGHVLRVGVPEVRGLTPATALRSRLVTIKVATGDDGPTRPPTEQEFAASARRKFDALGIAAAAELTLGKRRTLRIKQREIVGYEVLVAGLTAEESIRLQEQPDPTTAFSRRHMTCAVFMPTTENPS